MLDIIIGLANQRTESRASYFNLVNPSTTTWNSLLPAVTNSYGVKEVEFKEWIDVLDRMENPSESDLNRMPALKILEFYKALQSRGRAPVNPNTEHARRDSKIMRNLGPITESLMAHWIEQWNF